MASMKQVIDQQPQRGQAVIDNTNEGKNVNNGARNRRALGDIGNQIPVIQVVDGKKPQRPVTTSFKERLLAKAKAQADVDSKKAPVLDGAIRVDRAVFPKQQRSFSGRLLAKAQAQADVDNKKAPVLDGAIRVEKAVLSKPQRKVIEKTKSQEELKEEIKQEHPNVNNSKAEQVSSSLISVGKLACMIPENQTLDIDAADLDNELAVVEYVADMYQYYKLAEHESRVHDYIHSQEELNERMRSILIDWLVEVHNKFKLTPETLYLTINILDRYLASKPVQRRELQLVGVTAILLASKYEEIWPPEVDNFVAITDNAYKHHQVLIMEKQLLGELEWNLTVPTPYVFLVRFIKASAADEEMEYLVYFLAELGIMNYATIIYCPSMLAASAVYAARCTLNKNPVWNNTLKFHTGFSEAQLMDCAKLLVSFHEGAPENKLQAIMKKYSKSEKKHVSLLPPAQNVLAA